MASRGGVDSGLLSVKDVYLSQLIIRVNPADHPLWMDVRNDYNGILFRN
jgi:hypothetical protein